MPNSELHLALILEDSLEGLSKPATSRQIHACDIRRGLECSQSINIACSSSIANNAVLTEGGLELQPGRVCRGHARPACRGSVSAGPRSEDVLRPAKPASLAIGNR